MKPKPFRTSFIRTCVCVLILLVSACASLHPDYEKPTVVLKTLKPASSAGGGPSFEIELGILNPNASELKIDGIVYSISLQGHELVKGVGKDFPVIEGYSEGTISLVAHTSMMAGIRFIAETMRSGIDELEYEFKAKLDLSGIDPTIRFSETGSLDLGASGDESSI